MTVLRYPDGSTSRHVDRAACQRAWDDLRLHIEAEDWLGIAECWEQLGWDANKGHIWSWMSMKQRAVVRLALKAKE